MAWRARIVGVETAVQECCRRSRNDYAQVCRPAKPVESWRREMLERMIEKARVPTTGRGVDPLATAIYEARHLP